MESIPKSLCEANLKRIDGILGNYEKEIKGLNNIYKSINELTRSIDNLATETKYMREEQTELKDTIKSIDKRVDLIEKKPAEKWEKIVFYITTVIITAIMGMVFMQIGLQ